MDSKANNTRQQIDGTTPPENFKDSMTGILRVVALISVVLMSLGFIGLVRQNSMTILPGPSTASFQSILNFKNSSGGMREVSAGLIMFALIPSLRILLSFQKFIRLKDYSDAIIALIVFAELLLSMFL